MNAAALASASTLAEKLDAEEEAKRATQQGAAARQTQEEAKRAAETAEQTRESERARTAEREKEQAPIREQITALEAVQASPIPDDAIEEIALAVKHTRKARDHIAKHHGERLAARGLHGRFLRALGMTPPASAPPELPSVDVLVSCGEWLCKGVPYTEARDVARIPPDLAPRFVAAFKKISVPCAEPVPETVAERAQVAALRADIRRAEARAELAKGRGRHASPAHEVMTATDDLLNARQRLEHLRRELASRGTDLDLIRDDGIAAATGRAASGIGNAIAKLFDDDAPPPAAA